MKISKLSKLAMALGIVGTFGLSGCEIKFKEKEDKGITKTISLNSDRLVDKKTIKYPEYNNNGEKIGEKAETHLYGYNNKRELSKDSIIYSHNDTIDSVRVKHY